MKVFMFFCVIILAGLTANLALAQTLPTADWYAIAYQPETDTLHWINGEGEQASAPRPHLPEEVSFGDLRFSPNGRFMVVSGVLSNNRAGIGIYDFQFGRFIRTHEAQDGEQINVGYNNIFTSDSSLFAVGLFSGDFANPAWRVILFEAATGDSAAFIDNTHPDAPDQGLAAPVVQYLDGVNVHFHLQPQAVGGSITLPGYKWQASGFDPTVPIISESLYNRTNMDILPGTGEVVTTQNDPAFDSLAQQGPAPNFNSVAQGIPGDTLATVYADPTRYHLDARWANSGEWILILSSDQTQNAYWGIIEAGNNNYTPFDPQFVDAWGTADGYILLDGERNLLTFSEMIPSSATRIFQLSEAGQIVYVTPPGAAFAVTQLPDIDNPVAATTPTLVINDAAGNNNTTCPQALAQRMSVGSQGRVLPSLGALNIRSQPGGAVVTSLAGSVTFDVTGGPTCFDELFWWQVQTATANGWVAEGNFSNYYIQPYDGPVVVEPQPQPPAEDPTDTPIPPPPPSEGNPGNLAPNPTAEPTIFVPPIATFVCPGSPTPRLTAGGTATVISNTPMQVFQTANGPAVPYQLAPGSVVAVLSGPTCGAQDIAYWRITGNAINTSNQQIQQITGWVPEGTGGTYWLRP